MKPNKYLLLLLASVAAYGMFEFYRPKPIDWSPTYTNKDKIPFGTRVLFEVMPSLMNGQAVENLRMPVYNHLNGKPSPTGANYIFICHQLVLSRMDREKLLQFAAAGNQVFISAYRFPDTLANELGFKANLKAPRLRDTTLGVNFTNPGLKAPSDYHFVHDDGRNFLTVKEARNLTVLGRNARREPIFLKCRYGKGSFYIHNLPIAFTNYYVLDRRTADYAYRALSYLPPAPTFWDEYQKQGRFDENQRSSLRYLLSQPALAWAYYLTLAGLLLYVVFAGKRTQRVIPVVQPPKNTSLEFVQTIGRLYFQQGDHHNLARKKIRYFLAFLRERFGLSTLDLTAEFRQTLARKSGVTDEEINALFRQIETIEASARISEYDLLALNQKIEAFYQKV